MLESLKFVGTQVLILFIIMAVGFVCRKLRVMNESGVKGLTDPAAEARKYLCDKVPTVEDALAGARDIIAEVARLRKVEEIVEGVVRRDLTPTDEDGLPAGTLPDIAATADAG